MVRAAIVRRLVTSMKSIIAPVVTSATKSAHALQGAKFDERAEKVTTESALYDNAADRIEKAVFDNYLNSDLTDEELIKLCEFNESTVGIKAAKIRFKNVNDTANIQEQYAGAIGEKLVYDTFTKVVGIVVKVLRKYNPDMSSDKLRKLAVDTVMQEMDLSSYIQKELDLTSKDLIGEVPTINNNTTVSVQRVETCREGQRNYPVNVKEA